MIKLFARRRGGKNIRDRAICRAVRRTDEVGLHGVSFGAGVEVGDTWVDTGSLRALDAGVVKGHHGNCMEVNGGGR